MTGTRSLALVPIVLLLSAPAGAADARLDAAREKYAPSTWQAGPLRDGFVLGAFCPEGFIGKPVEPAVDGVVTRTYRDGRGGPGFAVEVQASDSVDQARERLLGWLAFVSAPGKRPTAASRGLPVGDAGFVGPSGSAAGRFSWITFLRGNVAVRLVDLDPTRSPAPDLAGIARELDRALLAAPELAPGARLTRPRVRTLVPATGSVVAGTSLALVVDVEDPTGTPTLSWVVGGSGQGYVEADGAGGFSLHTTGPGSISLTLEVTGANGSTESRESGIEVLAAPVR